MRVLSDDPNWNSRWQRILAANFSAFTPGSRIAEANSLRNSSALRAGFPILNRSAQGIFFAWGREFF
jgi:hypothetical protein